MGPKAGGTKTVLFLLWYEIIEYPELEEIHKDNHVDNHGLNADPVEPDLCGTLL